MRKQPRAHPACARHPMRGGTGHASESAFGACRLMSYVFTARPLRFAGRVSDGIYVDRHCTSCMCL